MTTIEIFTDIGSTEDDINNKYPQPETLNLYQKIVQWAERYKLIVVPVLLILMIYLFDNSDKKINQSGGAGLLAKAASPVSSTFGLVTAGLGHFFRLITLIITIILVPTIPIVLYCFLAYYVIKRFVFMITTVK